MFLRPYRSTDKRILQQLFFDTVHSVNTTSYSPEQLNVWAPVEPDREGWARLDTQYCFVVEFQKQIVGFASLDKHGLVDMVYVHKDFQGRGIAKTLLKQLERLARKKNLTEITAEATITARGFFESLGFEIVLEKQKTMHGVLFQLFDMKKKLLPLVKNNP